MYDLQNLKQMTKNTTISYDNFFAYQSALDTLTTKGLDNCIINTNNVSFSIEINLTPILYSTT